MLEGTVGVQRETAAKFREKGKSGGQFGLRWRRKSGTKSFEGGVNRFGRLEKFLPLRCRKFLPASLQKAQKGNGCTFVLRLVLRHCRWLLRIFSKVRSAVPKNPSEQKSGSPEVQTEGQQGRCAYRRGRNDRGTEKATEK